jgi:hypothetical protein
VAHTLHDHRLEPVNSFVPNLAAWQDLAPVMNCGQRTRGGHAKKAGNRISLARSTWRQTTDICEGKD